MCFTKKKKTVNKTQTFLSTSLSYLPKKKSIVSPLVSHNIPSSHRKDPWAEAIKFFITLSIYKTSISYSFVDNEYNASFDNE